MDAAELPALARTILDTLLDRAEQPGRQRVARVRLSERDYPAYFSPENAAPRRATNAAFTRLAAAGVLALRWRRWEEGNWLEAVDLTADGAALLYRLLGRMPRASQQDALHALVAAETALPGWHADFLAWASTRLAANQGAPPLDRDDLGASADLLRVLAAIACLEAPLLERTLSVRLFGDSKRIEVLRSGIVRVLRRHDPQASLYADDADALLRAHLLDRAPEYVPLAGPLTLRLASGRQTIELDHFQPSVALPAPLLRAAEVLAVKARAIISVENLTSFSELCAARPPDILAVYTGGFASPTLIAMLRKIRSVAPTATHWHWGDLDAGGLRILAHLRSQLGAVQPLAMDQATFQAYQASAQPLTTSDQAALTALHTHPLLADCTDLVTALLAACHKLEQEAVPAGAAVCRVIPVSGLTAYPVIH